MRPTPLRRWSRRLAALAFVVIWMFPVYWMLVTALKPRGRILESTPTFLPTHPSLDHFRQAVSGQAFGTYLRNSLMVTAITVVLGIALGMTGYAKIWPLFGAANQLLAALALLAVCAWLGNIGKNNKMFYIPMIFMLIVTLTSLAQTISTQVGKITAGAATDWAPYAQAILGVLLFILAIVLAVEGCMTIFGKKKNTAAK